MKPSALLAVSLACLAVSTTARAAGDAAPKTGIVTMIDQGQQWLKAATAGPTAASDPSTRVGSPTANRAEESASRASTTPESPQPFLALQPSAAIVARDWRGSLQVVGERSMIIDDVRPTASNRMVMGRFSTSGSRLSLFGQVGAGQWRVDTVMFPNALSDEELAGQVGGGFELRISPQVRLASEVDYTMLYRNLHYSENEVAPRMTSFVLAFAGTF